MNGSGLIYAAIVGAWAAYLVPMWLRRQDELNEARPTERFTTAIRILSRRGAFERRSARVLAEARAPAEEGTDAPERRGGAEPPRARQHSAKPAAPQQPAAIPGSVPSAKAGAAKRPSVPLRRDEGRAVLLTRRRRVIATLFATFTAGAILAGVAGFAWVWLPAVPGVLLSAYIVHLRVQERRRYEAGLRRLGRPASGKSGAPADGASAGESRPRAKARETHDATPPEPHAAIPPTGGDARQGRAPRSRPTGSSGSGASGASASASPRGRRDREAEEPALAEWIAELATDGGPHDRDTWDPVPVPLPTYVTAPVVPRGDVEQEPERPQIHAVPDPGPTEAPRPSTPLFDQYAEDTRTDYGSSVDSLPLYEHEWRRAVNE